MARYVHTIGNIQIKNIKEWMGQDMPAHQADIFIDGKKFGTFTEDGDGGPCRMDIPSAAQEAIEGTLRERGYNIELSLRFPGTYDADKVNLEDMLANVVEDAVFMKQFQKYDGKAIVVREGDEYLVVQPFTVPFQQAIGKVGRENFNAHIEKAIKKFSPGTEVINYESVKFYYPQIQRHYP